ncbi:hypothetical protein ABTG19_18865, partial [Acinetobacter baumannii]
LVSAFDAPNYDVKFATAESLTALQVKLPGAIPALTFAAAHPDARLATTAVTLLRDLTADTPAVAAAFIARLDAPRNAAPQSVELHRQLVRA